MEVFYNNLYTLRDNNLLNYSTKWKSKDISGWNGTNEMLFNAVPAGYRDDDGIFYSVGTQCRFWMYEGPNTQFVIPSNNDAYQNAPNNGKPGCSLRLIKSI